MGGDDHRHAQQARRHPADHPGLGGMRGHQVRTEGLERGAELAEGAKIPPRPNRHGEVIEDHRLDLASAKILREMTLAAGEHDDGMSSPLHRLRHVTDVDLSAA